MFDKKNIERKKLSHDKSLIEDEISQIEAKKGVTWLQYTYCSLSIWKGDVQRKIKKYKVQLATTML